MYHIYVYIYIYKHRFHSLNAWSLCFFCKDAKEDARKRLDVYGPWELPWHICGLNITPTRQACFQVPDTTLNVGFSVESLQRCFWCTFHAGCCRSWWGRQEISSWRPPSRVWKRWKWNSWLIDLHAVIHCMALCRMFRMTGWMRAAYTICMPVLGQMCTWHGLLHQSFLSTTWRGLWAMRLHQSLLRIGIGPHKWMVSIHFSLFRSAGRHFVFFFLVVVCGVKPMPSQPSFHLRFPLRPWGVGWLFTRQVGLRAGRYMFEARGPQFARDTSYLWITRVIMSFTDFFLWNHSMKFVDMFSDFWGNLHVLFSDTCGKKACFFAFVGRLAIHESRINLHYGIPTISTQPPWLFRWESSSCWTRQIWVSWWFVGWWSFSMIVIFVCGKTCPNVIEVDSWYTVFACE